MLTTRTPMKRTGFKPRAPRVDQADSREHRLVERAARALQSGLAKPLAHVAMAARVTAGAAIVKVVPLRSERYRRAVAALPCAWCHIEGYSQHAHENEGKGARTKLDDRRAMPLCCARPGIEGCHIAFDQYRLVPGGREAHITLGRELAAQTRKKLNDYGLWPKTIPQLNTEAA